MSVYVSMFESCESESLCWHLRARTVRWAHVLRLQQRDIRSCSTRRARTTHQQLGRLQQRSIVLSVVACPVFTTTTAPLHARQEYLQYFNEPALRAVAHPPQTRRSLNEIQRGINTLHCASLFNRVETWVYFTICWFILLMCCYWPNAILVIFTRIIAWLNDSM